MRNVLATVTLVLAAGSLLPGCITDPVTGETVFGIPQSNEEEMQLGLSYKPVIVAQYGGAYPDQEAHDYLGKIVLGMAENGARPDLDWSFTVLNSSVPNAFAIPGGQVFVTRGLLYHLEDEAAFAVVMGHEVGHVEHKHVMRSQAREALRGATVGIVTDVAEEIPVVGGIVGAGGHLFSMSYSRDQERESDVRGVDSAYRAGYDPRKGADVFRLFKRLKGGEGGGVMEAFLSSHPLDDERIENIARLSAEKDPRLAGDAPVEGLVVNRPGFTDIVTRMAAAQKTYERYDAAMTEGTKAMQSGDRAALANQRDALLGCRDELPTHAIFASAAGSFSLALEERDQARTLLEEAAAMNQGLFQPELLLGAMDYEDGENDAAIAHANRSLELLPGHYYAHFVRAQALWAKGDKAAAKTDYALVAEQAPDGSKEKATAEERK